MTKLQPAVFLDRDGTIIEDQGHLKHPDSVVFYPFAFDALRALQSHFLLFIITNQSGISKGLISDTEVRQVNRYVVETLRLKGVSICDVYYCPHRNEDLCGCKKPNPYFIHLAAGLYDVDLSRSFMIGDHPSDVACGLRAGVTPIYLLSGHGKKHLPELVNDAVVCEHVLEAAQYILSTLSGLQE